ncbi:MAG: pyridoxal 5'-phosphate synthase, partial [Thermomicrobiaceae bacterium]|nr:pyridoxal 5'-phosphate synthase [Thermomicrobiaceae bacterium]
MAIRALRKEYHAPRLREEDVAADPIAQFEVWLSEAVAAGLPEANAMTVATVDAEGHPDARVVLLKGVDARGFVFFTNYQSAKGRDLATTPYAALVFYWPGLGRQ